MIPASRTPSPDCLREVAWSLANPFILQDKIYIPLEKLDPKKNLLTKYLVITAQKITNTFLINTTTSLKNEDLSQLSLSSLSRYIGKILSLALKQNTTAFINSYDGEIVITRESIKFSSSKFNITITLKKDAEKQRIREIYQNVIALLPLPQIEIDRLEIQLTENLPIISDDLDTSTYLATQKEIDPILA